VTFPQASLQQQPDAETAASSGQPQSDTTNISAPASPSRPKDDNGTSSNNDIKHSPSRNSRSNSPSRNRRKYHKQPPPVRKDFDLYLMDHQVGLYLMEALSALASKIDRRAAAVNNAKNPFANAGGSPGNSPRSPNRSAFIDGDNKPLAWVAQYLVRECLLIGLSCT
jgi:hypothetical protein